MLLNVTEKVLIISVAIKNLSFGL